MRFSATPSRWTEGERRFRQVGRALGQKRDTGRSDPTQEMRSERNRNLAIPWRLLFEAVSKTKTDSYHAAHALTIY
jgi:hypothetical protein